MKGQSGCRRCGKCVEPGSAVVISYGAGGRIHKACVLPEEATRLANGDVFNGAPASTLTPQRALYEPTSPNL